MTDDRDHEPGDLELVVCPDCAAPAEVVDRFALPSTDGDVAHIKLRCLARHWFLLPATSVPTFGTLREPRPSGPVR